MASYNQWLTAEVASELQMILQTGLSFCYTIASHRKSPLEKAAQSFHFNVGNHNCASGISVKQNKQAKKNNLKHRL